MFVTHVVQNKAYRVLFINLLRSENVNEIATSFKKAREEAGISLEEASNDTEIPVSALEQIEEGTIGSFKDIFKLREYLITYAKYLGQDSTSIIDQFNEYMFEYTSKIPVDDLEKAIQEKSQRELEETIEMGVPAITPYLMPTEDKSKTKLILTIITIIILIAITLIWIIKQI